MPWEFFSFSYFQRKRKFHLTAKKRSTFDVSIYFALFLLCSTLKSYILPLERASISIELCFGGFFSSVLRFKFFEFHLNDQFAKIQLNHFDLPSWGGGQPQPIWRFFSRRRKKKSPINYCHQRPDTNFEYSVECCNLLTFEIRQICVTPTLSKRANSERFFHSSRHQAKWREKLKGKLKRKEKVPAFPNKRKRAFKLDASPTETETETTTKTTPSLMLSRPDVATSLHTDDCAGPTTTKFAFGRRCFLCIFSAVVGSALLTWDDPPVCVGNARMCWWAFCACGGTVFPTLTRVGQWDKQMENLVNLIIGSFEHNYSIHIQTHIIVARLICRRKVFFKSDI